MNASQLKPIGSLAKVYGAKSVLFGGPGSGKTPLIATCPNPVALITEPGLLSIRKISHVPAWEAYEAPKIDEFFKWFFESAESKKFDTLCVDSITQMAEIYLKKELSVNKDGRKAYGQMSMKVRENIDKMFYLPNKHIMLIAKQGIFEDETGSKKKPYFPGQELNVYVPHLFDEILHLGLYNVPGVVGETRAIRTKENFNTVARDRSGNLSEFEFPDMNAIFKKCLL